jgi:hypothetical protein
MRTDSVRDVLRGGGSLGSSQQRRTDQAELKFRDRLGKVDFIRKTKPVQLEEDTPEGSGLKPPKRSSSPVNAQAADLPCGFVAVPPAPRKRSKIGSLIAGVISNDR